MDRRSLARSKPGSISVGPEAQRLRVGVWRRRRRGGGERGALRGESRPSSLCQSPAGSCRCLWPDPPGSLLACEPVGLTGLYTWGGNTNKLFINCKKGKVSKHKGWSANVRFKCFRAGITKWQIYTFSLVTTLIHVHNIMALEVKHYNFISSYIMILFS